MITIKPITEAIELKTSRRIRKYVMIWCAKGSLNAEVDDNTFTLNANSVITITSGQIHRVSEINGAVGYVVEFTFDFFCKDDNDIELIFHNSLFCHFAMNEVIPLYDSLVVETELSAIDHELKTQPYQYLISIHSRLKLILVEINRQKIKNGEEIWKPDALFLKFLEAVRANFAQSPKVDTMADLLKTSVSTLNEHSKKHTGRTAQSVIHGLVASEAKRLFKYDKLSVKETAFALGFSDPFYFSNFFKKQTGISPKDYQASIKA